MFVAAGIHPTVVVPSGSQTTSLGVRGMPYRAAISAGLRASAAETPSNISSRPAGSPGGRTYAIRGFDGSDR